MSSNDTWRRARNERKPRNRRRPPRASLRTPPGPLGRRAWRAITEPGELAAWFAAAVDWKPEVGELFEAMGQRGEITDLEPPHRVAYTWGGERFAFELRPDGDGCLLVFMHVFDDRALGAQHATGWEIHLDRLDAHLAGEFVSEGEALKAFTDLHERYAERFGLDPEVGRRALAEHHQQG